MSPEGEGQRPAVTDLLLAWRNGEPSAPPALVSAVYAELRGLARAHMRRERPNHSLPPSAPRATASSSWPLPRD